jgi:predicted SnoaL-like aldol condensation-catalyzing enzyme
VSNHKREPGERGEIVGWTAGAARRNRDFLQSIDATRADGIAVAYTLTVRDVPEDAETWAALVDTFRKRLARMGAIRDHWVIEWQKRGAPHLHGFAYFCPNRLRESDDLAKLQPWPEDPEILSAMFDWLGRNAAFKIVEHWLDLSQRYRTSAKGQHVVPVHGLIGWLAYLMKHASRGADHYQRQRHQLPPGWQKSGRLWGKGGSWPTRTDSLVVDDVSGLRFRRALRAYGRAQARTQLRRGIEHGNSAQIATAKRALAYHRRFGHSDAETPAEKRRWSALRGSNVTIPGRAAADLLDWAIDHPHSTVSEGATVIDLAKS